MSGRALNPDPSNGAIAAKWQNTSPQVAVLDNLLTDEALERAAAILLALDDLAQVLPERLSRRDAGARLCLPAAGADCRRTARARIRTLSAIIRCCAGGDSNTTSQLNGINIHADFAAVNVNFWITPDEANLDPESGGLVIWDKPAPLEWDFAQYNNPNAGETIRNSLAEAGREADHRSAIAPTGR